MTLRPDIKRGPPESFGWQRRADLDTPKGVAYERPDGTVYLYRKDEKVEIARVRMPNLKDSPPR